MAVVGDVEILLDFEPIVKLICHNHDCQFNLMNAANLPERREAACNLKQIAIDKDGCCMNFRMVEN